MDEREHAAITRLIEAARNFVRVADEFWPDYPGAMSEFYEALVDALGALETD